MASISTQINLIDRMSNPLHNIMSAVESVIDVLHNVDGAIAEGFDTEALDRARRSIDLASEQLNNISDGTNENTRAQRRYNDEVNNSNSGMNGLVGKVMALASAYAGMLGVSQVLETSDQMAQTEARLSMIVDDGGSVDNLEQQIFASAERARAGYQETADTVAKLSLNAGDAFSSNAETIQFAENLNKQFVIAGASQAEMASASLQLTQALGSGTLRGEELNAVFEAAPNVIQTIADYMGEPIGKIRELASDGQISADIVKNAMLSATDEINDKFEQMPLTWGQAFVSLKNNALIAFEPLLKKINEVANSEEFNILADNVVNAMYLVATVVGVIFDLVGSVASFAINNWSIISPILYTAIGLLGAYLIATQGITVAKTILSAVMGAFSFIQGAVSIGYGVLTGQTGAASAATLLFNSALWACPLTWIILLIAALIAIIYVVIACLNKWKGETVSATGIIMSVFTTLAMCVANQFIFMWNYIVAFINFFANVFNDPVAAVEILFLDLASNVLGYVAEMASGIETVINKIPGVEIDITSGLDDFKNKIEDMSLNVKNNSEWEEVVSKVDFLDGEKSANWGYDVGESAVEKIQGAFDGVDLLSGSDDYVQSNNELVQGIQNNTAQMANNSGDIKDSVSRSDEDLKYIRETAERESINRYTTAEIKVDMGGVVNHVGSNNDLDGMMNYITTNVTEAMEIAAEGDHV